MATSLFTVRRTTVIALALVGCVACEEEGPARGEGHSAFYETAGAVSALSLARSASGDLLASWIESASDGDRLRWVPPGDDSAAAHAARLGDVPQTWKAAALLATGDGFVRFGSRPELEFGELWIAHDGTAQAFQRVFALATTFFSFQALVVDGEPVLLGVAVDGVEMWARDGTDWRLVAGQSLGIEPCVELPADVLPFAAAPWGPGEIAFLAVDSDQPQEIRGACAPRLRRILRSGQIDETLEIDGDVFDAETGEQRFAVGQLLAFPGRAIAALWLGRDGQIRVNVVPGLVSFDVDAPVFDADRRPVANPRLATLDDRFVLTYRADEDGELERTRAVTISADGDVSDPFDWPLDDGECVDVATVPRKGGLDYVCVGPCRGAACGAHWLYQGSVLVR